MEVVSSEVSAVTHLTNSARQIVDAVSILGCSFSSEVVPGICLDESKFGVNFWANGLVFWPTQSSAQSQCCQHKNDSDYLDKYSMEQERAPPVTFVIQLD